jgi:exopolysaccharide production protein ExoZ
MTPQPNPHAQPKMQTLQGIQYLRAVAALAVVLFHAAERSGVNFAIGAAGVDVFFVISGFIMAVISHRRPQTAGAFLKDRFLRIAPVYWIVTSVMIFGAAAGFFPNLVLDPLHVLGSYLFLPVPSPNSGALWPVLVQGWTLNYEMFFYGSFAATLLFPQRVRLPLLALTFIGLVLVAGLMPAPPLWLNFYGAPLILEFLAGVCLGRLWMRGRIPGAETGFGLMVAATLGFATIFILNLPFGTWICGPLALIAVIGILSLEREQTLPNLPLLSYLGDASFSIYLWHTLAISVVVKFGALAGLGGWLLAWTAGIAGSVLGVFAYEAIERPFQHLLKHGRLSFRLPKRQTAK